METLVQQARTISSGTIATLTGRTRYTEIEAVQGVFVEFCESLESPPARWQDAWELFNDATATHPYWRAVMRTIRD